MSTQFDPVGQPSDPARFSRAEGSSPFPTQRSSQPQFDQPFSSSSLTSLSETPMYTPPKNSKLKSLLLRILSWLNPIAWLKYLFGSRSEKTSYPPSSIQPYPSSFIGEGAAPSGAATGSERQPF
jgi:hypothetical protein